MLRLSVGLALAVWGAALAGQPHAHRFVCTDNGKGRICVVGPDGTLEWDYPARGCQDVWRLPNGNFLFTHIHGVKEVTPDKKVVFEFRCKGEVHSCQPLPDGAVLIGECGVPRLIEVTRDGRIRKEIRLKTTTRNPHLHIRIARKLPGGNYLVSFPQEGVVREFDPEGRKVWEVKAGEPFVAVRLPNGNTLIGCGHSCKVIEVNRKGQVVWQITQDELPGIALKWNAGVQRLPNGNTVFCNWLGHGQLGKGPHIVEVTPDKKVVWTFANHKMLRTVSNIMVLDVGGNPLKGQVLR